MTKPTIRVVRNIWGNYVCYVGKERDRTTEEEFVAQQWLNDKMKEGAYKVSPTSELKPK